MQFIPEADSKLNKKIFFQQIVGNVRDKNSVIINGIELHDVVIVNNDSENIIQETCMVSEENIFQRTLKKIHNTETAKKQSDIYLSMKRNKLNDLLIQGTTAFKNGIYAKALDYYENALNLINKDSYPDEFNLTIKNIVSIKYAIALCNYSLNTHGSLTTAESQLTNMIYDQGWGSTFPFLNLALAKVYYALKQYERCNHFLRDSLRKIDESHFNDNIYWPGSTSIISDINLDAVKLKMESLSKECSNINSPDAYCFYDACLDIGNSQKAIYFDSPAFIGYVLIKCSAQCKFIYHYKCWKKYIKSKETNILNSSCCTPGCTGHFSEIEVYDEKAQLKAKKKPKVGQSVTKKIFNEASITMKNEKENKTSDFIDTEQLKECKNLHGTKAILHTDNRQTDLLKNIKLNANVSEFVPEKKVDLRDNKNKTSALATQTQGTDTKSIFVQCSVDSSEKSIQTDHSDKDEDILKLKEFINDLTKSLHRAEDSYNILLKQKKCPCCKRASREWENDSLPEKNMLDTETLLSEIKQLKMKYLKLKCEMQEISAKLENEKLNSENQKYRHNLQTEVLKTQIKLLGQTNLLTSEREEELKKRNSRLRSILLKQIYYSRTMDINYLSSYIEKCNRIIWEMKDISSISSASTTPTAAEVNLAENNWMLSLLQATQCHNQATQYYEDILNKISHEDNPSDNLVIKPPSEIPTEPSNLCSQYFKTLLHIIALLNRQVYYQNSILFNNTQRNVPQNLDTVVPKYATMNAASNMEICGNLNEIKREISNDPCISTNTSVNNQVEDLQGANSVPSLNISLSEVDCKLKTDILAEEKQNKVTNDVSLFIQKSFPTTPIKQINDAIFELRQKHGKLTGMSIRRIRSEVQQILHKPNLPSPEVKNKDYSSAWAKVDNGIIDWQSDQREGDCPICYEVLEPKGTTQLRCKHIFHIGCIRQWLQTNSICPICRVFTMLDEEFPPLM